MPNSPLPWWQTGVTYQIYPRSFQDTNADGVGDLPGVLQRLDYLDSLGVDALWLSPFYPSPMKDFGYDVADYTGVHPLFGTLADFDALLAAAHARGMKVIIDYVPNHTSDQHPWFLESRSSHDNPKRDWYIWRDAKPDGSPPNNWGSTFGGPAWTWDSTTAQYYFHHFLTEQPDLNWRNPAVRAAMLDVLRYWLERGVDGFRMDVVGMILKDPDFRDNPPNPHAPAMLHPNDLVSRQVNVYNQDLDEVQEIITEMRRLLDSYGERVGIGEIWYDLPRWVRYYGLSGEGLHLPFNFRLIWQPWNAAEVRASVDALEAALPPFAWPNYVLGNHDVPRLASRFGVAQARVAAMLLLTLRGTPTLYYGDELGLENGAIAPHQIQDPQGINLGPERTRDVARTPMQWSDAPHAGFSSVAPWLPVSADYHKRNVQAQSADPRSILNLYRALLALRRGSPALHAGRYRALDVPAAGCYAYLRELDGERWLVTLNFSAEEREIALPDLGSADLRLTTYMDAGGPRDLARLALRPNEGLLLRLKAAAD